MKTKAKYFVGLIAILALCFAYFHRPHMLRGFTSFESDKRRVFHKSTYAISYQEAKEPAEDRLSQHVRIRWDLWCIAMAAKISEPKKKDGFTYYIFDATDRTDTRCIYVFSPEGELVEVSFQPLA